MNSSDFEIGDDWAGPLTDAMKNRGSIVAALMFLSCPITRLPGDRISSGCRSPENLHAA